MAADADRQLLFGLVALQNGLIGQGQLVAAFQAWARDRARPLADHLAARGDLDAEGRAGVDAMVALHLKKHGGDAQRSLAAIPAGRSTREQLAEAADRDIQDTLAHLGSGPTEPGDPDRTATYTGRALQADGSSTKALTRGIETMAKRQPKPRRAVPGSGRPTAFRTKIETRRVSLLRRGRLLVRVVR